MVSAAWVPRASMMAVISGAVREWVSSRAVRWRFWRGMSQRSVVLSAGFGVIFKCWLELVGTMIFERKMNGKGRANILPAAIEETH